MSSRFRVTAAAAALLLAVLPGTGTAARAAGPNLIVNGGFEHPVVQPGAYQLFSTGQSFPGWSVVGARGNIAPISGQFIQSGITFTAGAGNQWLDLTGLSNTATGVAQSVKTVPGARYRLSFAVGNVVDPGGTFGSSSTVNVYFGNRRVISAKNSAGGLRQAWKTFTLTIKATSARTTIKLVNGDGSSDNDNGLDTVSLTKL